MSPLRQHYPIVLAQDLIWGDMDAFAHINNTVYFRYFEDARIAYFEQVGINALKASAQIGPILANTHCNFKLPLHYPDHIHIAARSSILSAKKFSMEYTIYSKHHDAIVADGGGLLVYYDYKLGKSCDIPESIADAMNELE
jgi:acyl-CoA thioester hydrolase